MDAKGVYYYLDVTIVYTKSRGYVYAILASSCLDSGLMLLDAWTTEKMYIAPLSLDILSMIDNHLGVREPNIISYILMDTLQNSNFGLGQTDNI